MRKIEVNKNILFNYLKDKNAMVLNIKDPNIILYNFLSNLHNTQKALKKVEEGIHWNVDSFLKILKRYWPHVILLLKNNPR